MSDPRIRQLRIKTGVLKRAAKEKESYAKELQREIERLEEFKSASKDEHDIRHQGEVIKESQMMIPDTQKRIITAYNDLKLLVEESTEDLNELEEFIVAKTLLENVVY